MRKRLYVKLMGGLGNQMFQYAAGRSFSLQNDFELILDNITGFKNDKQFFRKFELSSFSLNCRNISSIERYAAQLYLKDKKIHLFYNPIFENDHTRIHDLREFKIGFKNWMIGYWQSPEYFNKYCPVINKELTPPNPKRDKVLELSQKIKKENSVAIGIRLYEETKNIGAISSTGRLKSIHAINKAILAQQNKIPNAKFYVFCTHKFNILNQLNIPKDSLFITHESGFRDSVETLWLLTQFKHHIITNSSFFWWGAWLSSKNYKPSEQNILAADNFINKATVPCNWIKF